LREGNILSWRIFDGWQYDRNDKMRLGVKEWDFLDFLLTHLVKYNRNHRKILETFLNTWNKKLLQWGGEPSFQDWKEFRPLRLSKEEDWSDWLQHLLASSKYGDFARRLFSITSFLTEDYKEPKVEREVLYESYRGDLIILWGNKKYTHLEVKIGDPSLEKTYECSRRLQKKAKARSADWNNFILLLGSQLSEWDACKKQQDSDIYVNSLTWKDVALALRRSLLFSKEDTSWKVWAISFLGAIEQKLLMFPVSRKKHIGHELDLSLPTRIDYFKEALNDEK
jgi:hypothetical protein